MCEERVVVLRRGGGSGGAEGGLGVCLLGESGPAGPHVIYRVEDDSPAARSGQVEAGDVILKVNGTDVNRFSTREVLKCLRLSSDPVTLRIKRDPQVVASVRHFLSTSRERIAHTTRYNHDRSISTSSSSSSSSSRISSRSGRAGSSSEALLPSSPPPPPPPHPKFEAYMMTGDLILNLSRVEHHNHHAHTRYHRYNSTPASPVQREPHSVHRYHSSPASSVAPAPQPPHQHTANCPPLSPSTVEAAGGEAAAAGAGRTSHSSAVRTSRSEDQLQVEKEWSLCGAGGVEPEEDVTSSLNTLLDTRPTPPHHKDRSSSPASPTSVSSSVMSSRATPTPHHRLPSVPTTQSHHQHRTLNGDMSLSEAMSNMSSPDYQEQDELSAGRDASLMELSDPSDSDSTILVSEPCHKRVKPAAAALLNGHSDSSDTTIRPDDYRIVIQVKGPEKQNGDLLQPNGDLHSGDRNRASSDTTQSSCYPSDGHRWGPDDERNDSFEALENTQNERFSTAESGCGSDEGSDAESLHSFHYSPKAVDLPSAERLAKRLYHLDGFKKSDVSRHLSKNNEFSRAVAEEYVKHFELSGMTLDAALRLFLSRFALSGETQERERVLVHFSRRYLECNPGAFNSQDAVHTLTCAIMLLNTDLHGGGPGATFRRMTSAEFVDNLADLNDGDHFPRETLEQLYKAIRAQPLQWALDTEGNGSLEKGGEGAEAAAGGGAAGGTAAVGSNPFLDVPDQSKAVEYKKGYVMRKCCYDANGKKTPFGKRSWKMFYCTLRDLVLYLHKDDHGFTRGQMTDSLHNAIRIHHALASRASDYTKKQHVFRLQTADRAEYLFQTSDSKELSSWVDTINAVCAAHSAPPLASAVGSQRKFQRPLLPCSHTKLNMRDQLAAHGERVTALQEELGTLRAGRDGRDSHQAADKENYLIHELKRYRTYVAALQARRGAGCGEEPVADRVAPPPP